MSEWDDVHVTFSGCSSVRGNDGLPEGGSLVSPLYPALPESFIRRLHAEDHGVGLVLALPQSWRVYVWHGAGSPLPELVMSLVSALRAQAPLPSQALLRA